MIGPVGALRGVSSFSTEAALTALYEATSIRVYAYARRHTDAEVAPDVVAEVYLVAWKRRGVLPDEPLAWLLVTARNVLHRHWRNRSRQLRLATELAGIEAVAAASEAHPEERLALGDAFARLSEDDRETLLLVGWDGLTPKEAAGVLGCSANAFPGRVSPPAAAAEIGEVAAAASERPRLEWGAGQYLRVESVDTQRGLWTDAGLDPTVSLHTTFDEYHSPDGWTWSDRVVDGAVEQYLFPPSYGWSRPDYAAGLPTEPHLLDAFLRLRAFGSSSVDEAVFQAVATMLRAESAPPQVRSAAVGVLGLNPKVSVADATDPRGRAALKVVFTDEAARPGMTQFLYIDRATATLLASGTTGGGVDYLSVITLREVVDALPADLEASLGTDRVFTEISGGQRRTFETPPGADPVPAPGQAAAPRR